MHLYPSEYPLEGDFKFMPIVGEQQMLITSAYNMTRVGVTQDIINLFSTYNRTVWIGILSVFVTLIALLTIGRCLLENKKNILESMWIISMFALDKDYLIEINNFLIIFSTFLSFFCFFMTQCLLNGMSTDMVVIPDPMVVQSFQDIIDLDHVSPAFLIEAPDYEQFKKAAIGTIEWKVWQKGLKLENREKKAIPSEFRFRQTF